MNKDITLNPENWKILFSFSLIRLILAVFICSFFVFKFNYTNPVFQTYIDWKTSSQVSIFYLIFVLSNLVLQYFKKNPFKLHLYIIIVVDIIIFTILIYYNNIIALSLVVLINVIIAGGCLVSQGRISLFFAAIATCALLVLFFIQFIQASYQADNTFLVALGGISYFVTAVLIYNISQNMRLTKALTEQQAKDLAALQSLNNLIIQRMQIGLIIVDKKFNLNFINPFAEKLLHNNQQSFVEKIRKSYRSHYEYFTVTLQQKKLLSYIIKLENYQDAQLAIFIEDADFTEKRAQQLKLASLGKFTASIAHEIRNPLSVINQATDILHDTYKDVSDRKLFVMIKKNINRINDIITNILELSKRHSIEPSKIELNDFVEKFIIEQNYTGKVQLALTGSAVLVEFEPKQLFQVLANLIQNALQHNLSDRKVIVKIRQDKSYVYLSVIDFGEGINDENQYNIFEPFYTTSSKGVGLGLYLCKEFCNMYHAEIYAVIKNEHGACIEIRFNKIV